MHIAELVIITATHITAKQGPLRKKKIGLLALGNWFCNLSITISFNYYETCIMCFFVPAANPNEERRTNNIFRRVGSAFK